MLGWCNRLVRRIQLGWRGEWMARGDGVLSEERGRSMFGEVVSCWARGRHVEVGGVAQGDEAEGEQRDVAGMEEHERRRST